jgi:hypothetical protein
MSNREKHTRTQIVRARRDARRAKQEYVPLDCERLMQRYSTTGGAR